MIAFDCGNPSALAGLHAGETALGPGSGGGLARCLASQRGGPNRRVTDVDMTPELIERVPCSARSVGYANAELRTTGPVQQRQGDRVHAPLVPRTDGPLLFVSSVVVCLLSSALPRNAR